MYQKLRKFTIWNEIPCTNLQLPPETLTRGLPLPDHRSVCPLSSTEFVETPPVPPPPNKIPVYATDVRSTSLQTYARIKVIAEVLKNISLFWDITPRHLFNINRRYTEVAASIFGV